MAQRVVFEESTLSYPLLTEEDVLRSDARLSSLVEDLPLESASHRTFSRFRRSVDSDSGSSRASSSRNPMA